MTAGDRNALTPMLAKQGKRIGAGVMLLIGADHRVIAGTLEPEIGRRADYPKLLDRAAAAQQASGIVLIGRPALSARDRAGDGAVAGGMGRRPGSRSTTRWPTDLRSLTGLEVSLLGRHDDGAWRMAASTLPERRPATRSSRTSRPIATSAPIATATRNSATRP